MKSHVIPILLFLLIVITPKAFAQKKVINPEIAQTVFTHQQLNKQKLKSAKLVWTMTAEQPATIKTPKHSQYKIHTRWIKEKKFTVHTTEENTITINRKLITQKTSKIHTYNGKTHSITDKLHNPTQVTLRKGEPKNAIDDWLAIINWEFYGTQENNYAQYLEDPNFQITWSKTIVNNKPLIQVVFQSLKHNSEKAIYRYDPAQGYNLISEQNYSKHGKLFLHRIYENKQVAPSLFMPTQIAIAFSDPKTGIQRKSTQFSLLLDKCKFNQPIPDEIFTPILKPGIKVIDHTSDKKKEYVYQPPKK